MHNALPRTCENKYEVPYLALNKLRWLEQQHSRIIYQVKIIAWLHKECTVSIVEFFRKKKTELHSPNNVLKIAIKKVAWTYWPGTEKGSIQDY